MKSRSATASDQLFTAAVPERHRAHLETLPVTLRDPAVGTIPQQSRTRRRREVAPPEAGLEPVPAC